MGRKKGSKNKPKTENKILQQAAKDVEFVAPTPYDVRLDKIDDAYVSEADKCYHRSILEPIAEVMEDVELAKKKIAQLRQKPTIIHGKRIDIEAIPEMSYPSNWNEMGKVEKLKFLTANPRK